MLSQSVMKAVSEDLQVVDYGGINRETDEVKQGYMVIGTEDKAYFVTVEEGLITKCDCPHSHFRNTVCKHMLKVSMQRGLDISALYLEKE